TTTINGIQYREILLDDNQTGGAPKISLDELKLYLSSVDNLTGYPGSFGTPFYDLDAGGDNAIIIDTSLSGAGSGKLDMVALIPSSLFGADNTKFVYLYS